MILRAIGYQKDSEIVAFRQNCWNLKCRNPGIDVDYLIAALKLTGLEAEVIPIDYPAPKAVEMIANGSADLTVHAIIQNVERLEKVDFTVPINYLVYGYMIMEIDEFQIKDFILSSLHPEMLLLLLMGLLIKRHTLANSFFMISWFWFCFFFTLHFESAMTSAFTLSSRRGYDFINLDGLLDAVEKKGWHILVHEEIGWNPMAFCKHFYNQCNRLENALKKAVHVPRSWNPDNHLTSKSVLFVGLHEHLVPTDVIILNREKRLLFIKDSSLQPSHLSFALNKNLSKDILEKLNRGLETIQGSYANFAARYANPFTPYVRSVHSSGEFYALGLLYLWPLFRLCLIFIGLSIGALLIEVIQKRIHYKKFKL
ncbi:unnamed protein product, partial [Mesorhabditis belari]|uniref:Solute-binding protein family 3/N-terminal domain-containing protein n=1 Tax=Mesorhabditis belari TaxID=2138241 RepID=A0AAF3ERE0_9BILA